ncbi:MAG: type IV pilin N-terminal domain-containing protein [Methanomicrobiaceae archaeon]|nr:type IV pilin N-terminal domain-containing protein [Methanomicrobiaceae archaeon]
MNFHENEEAVSPVIGVILMVAITVILAAVIAVFVFGMAGDVQSTKSVGVTAKQSGPNAIVTYMGGPDHASVQRIDVTIDGAPATINGTAQTNPPAFTSPAVGSSWIFDVTNPDEQNRVVVVALFSDGSSQVILDTQV